MLLLEIPMKYALSLTFVYLLILMFHSMSVQIFARISNLVLHDLCIVKQNQVKMQRPRRSDLSLFRTFRMKAILIGCLRLFKLTNNSIKIWPIRR